MTDEKREGLGKRSGEPERPRTPRGPCRRHVDPLNFPGSTAPYCPPPPNLAGFIHCPTAFPATPCSCDVLSPAATCSNPHPPLQRPSPLCPTWLGASDFPTPRASQACPVPAPLGPAPSAQGGWAPSPQTSHRPARPGHAQCGRSGLGPGSAGAAAGCRARRSRTALGGRGSWLGRSQAAELPGRCWFGRARPLGRGRALGVRGACD